MTQHQFLLDENIDPRLRAAIHGENDAVVVWIVGDPGAPPLSTDDPEILTWCDANGFSLVTKNRSSMRVHVAAHMHDGGEVLGIFVPSPDMSLGDITDDLLLVWEAADASEFINRFIYLPI